MEPFGPLFKELRLEKNYSLKETAEGIVSEQSLANFEAGNSDIKLSNFMLLLNKIHLTYEEMLYRYDDRSIVDFSKIAREFHSVTGTVNDRFRLKKLSDIYQKLYNQHHSEAYLHISILCEALSTPDHVVAQEKIDIVRDYLLKSESWTKYEFFLFELLPGFFDGEELETMYNRIIHDARKFPKYYEVIDGEVILNVIFDLIRKEEIDTAEKYLNNFYQNYPETNLDNLNFCALAEYLKGLIMICRGDNEGSERCYNYLNFIDTVPKYHETKNILMTWIDRCYRIQKKLAENKNRGD